MITTLKLIVTIPVHLFWLYLIAANIIRLIHLIKCRKIKHCTSRRCIQRYMCKKWVETYTDEDIENLYKFIRGFQ